MKGMGRRMREHLHPAGIGMQIRGVPFASCCAYGMEGQAFLMWLCKGSADGKGFHWEYTGG